MPEPQSHAVARADRILDVAGTLLLRWGYRKVTIEDIANQAGIGKGTVYLHWRTKDQLFEALLLRESIGLTEELLSHVRKDPAEIAPHRFTRAAFLATVDRPLIIAILARDTELLGRLTDRSVRSQELLAQDRFFTVLTRHRLLRDDIPDLAYAMQAASAGFYLADHLVPEGATIRPQAKADALAHIIRHAFEPPEPPDPGGLVAAAAEITAVLDDLISSYRKWIYSHDSVPEPG